MDLQEEQMQHSFSTTPCSTPGWYWWGEGVLAGTLACPELAEKQIIAKWCGKQCFYQLQAGTVGAIGRFLYLRHFPWKAGVPTSDC